jgi:L-lysine exporter family protein LysE/ArgO
VTAAFAHGFLLALALILPLGPQNTFVLAQGATGARLRDALAVAAVAALCDTALIGASVAGVSLVVLALPGLRVALDVLGVAFLGYAGLGAWRTRQGGGGAGGRPAWPLGRRLRYSVSVSFLNPHAILDTVVVLGGGAALYTTADGRWAYATAAALVSWLWFLALSLVGRALGRAAGGAAGGRWLGRASALVMWAVALRYALALVR